MVVVSVTLRTVPSRRQRGLRRFAVPPSRRPAVPPSRRPAGHAAPPTYSTPPNYSTPPDYAAPPDYPVPTYTDSTLFPSGSTTKPP